MSEVNSFTEVRENEECVVIVGERRYELGYVKRVYATHPTYVVWGDRESKIWYEIDHATLTLPAEFHGFWIRYQELHCKSLHNLQENQKKSYLGTLASSLSSALEGELAHAQGSLESAYKFLDTANERASKRRYILGVIGFVALACTTSIRAYLASPPVPESFFWLLMVAVGGGAIGALLSSTSGEIRDVRFDPNATALDGYLNGALRVLYGICGALVAVVAVKSGIVNSNLINPENEKLVLLFVAFGGGFTERQAANIIKKLSNNNESN